MGQEIVERIRSRGSVHRKFTGFVLHGDEAAHPRDKIVSGEKEVGEITSAATYHSRSGTRSIALGYIRREAGIPGREVLIGGRKAVVFQKVENVTTGIAEEAVLRQA